jgi:hypothetical protein
MTSPEIMLQRRAMAIEEALEATYENVALLGLPTSRIEALKAEPLLANDDAIAGIVAELASALAAERRLRSELGVELGKLYDRLDELEKAEATAKK